jgi:hypothetical protein
MNEDAGFEIVKAKGGFYIFEGLGGEWIVCLKTRKEADRWIAQTIAARAEEIAHAAAVAEANARDRAARKAQIAAARAAAPQQMEMML